MLKYYVFIYSQIDSFTGPKNKTETVSSVNLLTWTMQSDQAKWST